MAVPDQTAVDEMNAYMARTDVQDAMQRLTAQNNDQWAIMRGVQRRPVIEPMDLVIVVGLFQRAQALFPPVVP